MQLAFWIWLALLLAGTILPMIREQTWWLRAWTYGRLQMFWMTVLTGMAYMWAFGYNQASDYVFLSLCIFILGVCFWDILPFTRLFPAQSRRLTKGETHIPVSLLVGNVLMDNHEAEGLLASIDKYDPDMVFLVETDDAWKGYLDKLDNTYKYAHKLPLPDYNGMMLYSRFPLENVQVRYLVQDHIPSITADIIVQQHTVRFYGVHPRPPRPQDDTADLDAELSFIAHECGHTLEPVIVTGDLNDVGWSSTTRKFLRTSGLQDPRRGRGLYNSYNAKNPLIRWPLDHIFHSRDFSLIEMERLPAFGSDHFPIYIKLGLMRP